jgi:hypothetical protein
MGVAVQDEGRRSKARSGRNCIQTQSIEVVDWEEHVDDAVKVIKQKCQRAWCSLEMESNSEKWGGFL